MMGDVVPNGGMYCINPRWSVFLASWWADGRCGNGGALIPGVCSLPHGGLMGDAKQV